MSEIFADYLSNYLKQHANQFKQYLLAALENKDHYISYLEFSNGVENNSQDLRNCELLCDAQLFRETVQISRNGRNFYKNFYLTNLGLKLAEELRQQKPLETPPEQKPP
jgi:hypothetical protein